MAKFSVNEVLDFLDEDGCINEVITNGSDDEFEFEDDRYAIYIFLCK